MNIGKFIRMKRYDALMTLQELYEFLPTGNRKRAKGTHGGQSAVSKIESGTTELRLSQLEGIAGAFGQSAAEFLAEFESQ